MTTIGPLAVPGYHVGDARELLRKLPDESVNCCVTSPPYWALRSYLPGRVVLRSDLTDAEIASVLAELATLGVSHIGDDET